MLVYKSFIKAISLYKLILNINNYKPIYFKKIQYIENNLPKIKPITIEMCINSGLFTAKSIF